MVSNINEIDFDYVIGLGYNLHTVSLSTNSTLEEIENALFNIGNTDTLPSELLKDDYEKTKGLKLSNLLNSFVNKENTKTFVDIFNLIYK